MDSKKERLDVLVYEQGLAPSRERAQALIMRGDVLVNDVPVDKPGTKVKSDAEIRIRGEQSLYVGRGGEKLAGALDHFQISVTDCVALDVGASTGGFTDCMLQRGARIVYAIDVGYNQLDVKLRSDQRVRCYEKTHVKDLGKIDFNPRANFVTIDVSFIGVSKILQFIFPVLAPDWRMLILVKPQFELQPEYIGKGGVVREEKFQRVALDTVSESAVKLGAHIIGDVPSALRGAKSGNQEHFLFITNMKGAR